MDRENLELKISSLHVKLILMTATVIASVVISVMALSHC